MAADQENTKTYRGNCHCGAFVYEATLPEITTVSKCDCSLCSKKAYHWTSAAKPGSFKVVKGDEDDLSVYAFGSKAISHKFCPTCGSALLARMPTGPNFMHLLINTRCLQNFDNWDVKTEKVSGSDFKPAYEPPKFSGADPTAEIEGGKVYYGSCHCGAVTLAAKMAPLDETYKDRVVDCNCSICQRNGCIWTYPKKEQVVLNGWDNIADYRMGKGIMSKKFCKTCGVHISNMSAPLSQEEENALPDDTRYWYEGSKTMFPLNVRVLNGFDPSPLPISRFDGLTQIKPEYVNP